MILVGSPVGGSSRRFDYEGQEPHNDFVYSIAGDEIGVVVVPPDTWAMWCEGVTDFWVFFGDFGQTVIDELGQSSSSPVVNLGSLSGGGFDFNPNGNQLDPFVESVLSWNGGWGSYEGCQVALSDLSPALCKLPVG